MHAAFVFQRRPHAVFRSRGPLGANGNLHILDTAKLGGVLGLHADGPAAFFGISGVHAQQIACEQRGLFAAGTGFDLHDRIARIVRIAWNKRCTQLLLHVGQFAFKPLGLGCEIRILGRHFTSRFKIVLHGKIRLVCGDDATELGMTTAEFTHRARVGHHFGAGHLFFKRLIFLQRSLCRGELFVCHVLP